MSKECVSQRDVAEMMGVHQSTVSYALRGTSNKVSEQTRDRVRQLCKKLNYQANAHAQSLRLSKSNLIGVVVAPMRSLFHAHLIGYLSEELAKAGYYLMLRLSQGSQKEQKKSILEILDQRSAGVIVVGAHGILYQGLPEGLRNAIPLVSIGTAIPGTIGVGSNRFMGARLAGEHLADIGCKCLASIVDTKDFDVAADNNKWVGFRHAAKEAGLPEPIELADDAGTSSGEPMEFVDVGYELAKRLRKEYPDVDGVFCGSDNFAIGMVSAFRHMGVRVPQDVAVVGFDDIPEARHAAVPLTTIRQPLRDYARIGVELLTAQIENKGNYEPRSVCLDCELVVRESTVPVPREQ